MRTKTITLLSLLALVLAPAAWGAAEESDTPLQAVTQGVETTTGAPEEAGSTFRYLSDATGDGECDADTDAEEGCGAAVVCPCTCNGVAYPVTIYPERHGETCAQVNGRPCTNNGVNWFTLQNC